MTLRNARIAADPEIRLRVSTVDPDTGRSKRIFPGRARHVRMAGVEHEAVDIADKLSRFSQYWSPKVVARLNDYEIKVVKVRGEFVWHTHEDTDELFLVVSGELTIQLRDGDVVLHPGQLFVVPRGVEHCPVAEGEVHALLIEPAGVVNTGSAGGALTAVHDASLL
ncbi:cupin domain-containing protein [Micromonospora sp. NBC_01699]|uniref:cupin domain-containing protein n=1 Tax=Micromonospora sp. NBC_01699 TaxID=2975984 RepID=UPI002E2F3D39|nr:cupin domain-containing protein [Micromonospora sp. NBC_01699]